MLIDWMGPGDLDVLTWTPGEGADDPGATAAEAYGEISAALRGRGAEVLMERVFGRIEAAETVCAARRGVLGPDADHAPAPTYIEGRPCNGTAVAGIHIIAARPAVGGSSEVICQNGTPCGRLVDGADARYFGLSDIARLLGRKDRKPDSEVREILHQAIRLLEDRKWSFHDVRRTWFFLDDILSWYDDFNLARNEVFGELGLLPETPADLIPASTGIRGRNPCGHRCTLDLLAIRPADKRRIEWTALKNPLQNEAPEYGSAFSRGLSAATPRCRFFFVSGTASINEAGDTVHRGDFDGQTQRTLDNIESLLASSGAALDDICQATAFVKRSEDFVRLRSILKDRGLDNLPMVFVVDDICRDDLLVEIDAMAMVPVTGGVDTIGPARSSA